MDFNYYYQEVATATLDVDDIGNVSIIAKDPSGMEYYLIISTELGLTKTFEYGLSGLVTIATETKSNQEVINNCNGILIKDNPSSFCDALELLYLHKIKFDSNVIRESFNRYEWNNIVQKELIPIIEQVVFHSNSIISILISSSETSIQSVK